MPRISLSPKADFLRDASRASAHQDVMASPQFKTAAATALLAYQYNKLRLVGDPTNPAAISLKLQGAQEFLEVLMNLGEPEEPRGAPLSDNLTNPDERFTRKAPGFDTWSLTVR